MKTYDSNGRVKAELFSSWFFERRESSDSGEVPTLDVCPSAKTSVAVMNGKSFYTGCKLAAPGTRYYPPQANGLAFLL